MSAPDTEPPLPPAHPATETGNEGFVSRWSRRKRTAESGKPLPDPAPQPPAAAPATDLPDPATLGFNDDFSAYLGAQVPAALKRTAMARLFSDPSFNRMDGLDVYIEDYNLVPNLPSEERDLLAHAREVLNPTPVAEHASTLAAKPARDAQPPAPMAGPLPPVESPSSAQATAPDGIASEEAERETTPLASDRSRT
jgi:hypothetical protein